MVRRRVYADSESEYIKDLGRKLSDQTERILKSEEEWKRFKNGSEIYSLSVS